MKKISAVLLILFLLSFGHPFYLSVTDLKYSVKEKALQGSVRVFVNDLETSLKKSYGKTIDLIHVKDSSLTKSILSSYLKNHFKLKVNGVEKTLQLLGFETEEEAIWLYVAFKKCVLPKKVEIENKILFELLNEQTNIVHIEINKVKNSLKATNPDCDFVFNF
jgi:hypothetical protein